MIIESHVPVSCLHPSDPMRPRAVSRSRMCPVRSATPVSHSGFSLNVGVHVNSLLFWELVSCFRSIVNIQNKVVCPARHIAGDRGYCLICKVWFSAEISLKAVSLFSKPVFLTDRVREAQRLWYELHSYCITKLSKIGNLLINC